MKSLWYVLYDIMTIAAPKQLKSSSVFCQVNGFFFAMGIEAADAAVFLIALHSTICIFWSNRAGGDSGLYPYRRGAYAFFALWPVLMASLAFVTGTSAYANTGHNCYLPTKPWWYRTALSWIPRYINLLLILLMYGSSYLYIRVLMNRYSRRNSKIPAGNPIRIVPPTPPLMAHNLIPPSPAGSITGSTPSPPPPVVTTNHTREDDTTTPTEHLKTRETFRQELDLLSPVTRIKKYWGWAGFGEASGAACTPDPSSAGVSPFGGMAPPVGATTAIKLVEEAAEETGQASVPPVFIEIPKSALVKKRQHDSVVNTPSSTKSSHHHAGVQDYFTGGSSANAAVGRAAHHHTIAASSQVHIRKVLQEGPLCPPGTADSDKSSPPLLALDQATFESGGIWRSRERLRRQLRYLFVYPAVYACIWIFPFVNDLSIFDPSSFSSSPQDDEPSRPPPRPYWLVLCSLVSLSTQGLADSLVFCAREKPWRHLRGGGFWHNLGLDVLRGWRSWTFTLRKDSGRTREEMFNDSRRARSRREEEEELELENEVSRGGCVAGAGRGGGGRHWWDVADFEEGGPSRRDHHRRQRGDSMTAMSQEEDEGEEEGAPCPSSGTRRLSLAEGLSRIIRRVSLVV